MKKHYDLKTGGQALRIVFLGAIAWLCVWGIAWSIDDLKSSLRGLAGVAVAVEIDDTLQTDGLTPGQMKADVTLRLSEAGIRILTDKEQQETDGRPLLLLRVTGSRVQENWQFYIFGVTLYLVQEVNLARGNALSSHSAATWFDNSVSNGYLPDIRTRAKEMVDAFSTAFRTANP